MQVRAAMGQSESDIAGAGADIDGQRTHADLRRRERLQGDLDQSLCFGTRDQRPFIAKEIQPAELDMADDIGQRPPAQTVGDQTLQTLRHVGGNSIPVTQSQLGRAGDSPLHRAAGRPHKQTVRRRPVATVHGALAATRRSSSSPPAPVRQECTPPLRVQDRSAGARLDSARHRLCSCDCGISRQDVKRSPLRRAHRR